MSAASNTAPARLPHLRILASAGSGKTWQLSNRYLELVDKGADPSTILASTFTRLAAGEIRDRILERLANAAEHDGERELLAGSINRDELDRAQALELLGRLARNIHRMNIRTLDSYFASIVACFPLELGIPPGCTVVDEEEAAELRAEAIERLLREHDPQPLVEALRLLTRGDSERSIFGAIDRTVDDLYAISLEADDDAWACLPRVAGELDPPAIVGAIETLRHAPLPDHKTFRTQHAIACDEATAWNWEAFLSTGIASKIVAGETNYCRKPIDGDLRAVYDPLVRHARAWVINNHRDQSLATRALLTGYRHQYEAIKRERGVVTFGDLTTALDRAERIGSLDEICWRIDRTLEHVLLDEFQDTSIPQWRALEPNMRELVGDETTGRTFFCVGDLKQSIYGWRDASPEILAHVPELLFGVSDENLIRTETLPTSWRSAPAVIEAVNGVFHSIAANPSLDEHPDVAEAWTQMFDEHSVAAKNRDLPGYVELRAVERDAEGKGEPARIEGAIDLAARLHQAQPGMTIGILTRGNKLANRILFELHQRDIPASGAGGGPLTDVPAVNAVLDLLRLAGSPEDTVAAFNVATSPLGAAVGLEDFRHAGRRRAVARRVRRDLYERGFGPTLAAFVPKLAPSCAGRELRRLVRLVNLAEAYDATGSRDLAPFIRLVERRAVSDSRPAPVQVMTVHKSKGLEFDAVILPELDSKLAGGSRPKVLYDRESVTGRITRACRYIRSDVRDMLREEGCDLERMFEAETFRRVREGLCLLYVAMTRAKQGLYMLVDPPRENKDGSTRKDDVRSFAGVVWSALGAGPPGPGEVAWARGDESARLASQGGPPLRAGSGRSALPADDQDSPALPADDQGGPALPAGSGGPALRADTSPSALARSGPLRDRLTLPNRDATDRGHALHAMFETIEWIEDFEPDDEALRAAARAAAPRRDDAWLDARVAEFREAIASPNVRQTLSRPAGADSGGPALRADDGGPALRADDQGGSALRADARVYREHRFVRPVGDELQRGAIDRLVAHYQDGRCTASRVIDFRTDAITPQRAAHAAEAYRPQIDAYRAAAAAFLRVDAGLVEGSVVFIVPGVVVDLGAPPTDEASS